MPPIRPRRAATAAALTFGAASCLSQAAPAAEALLFDGNNCTGDFRMLDRSVGDFTEIGFDNEVNSLMVITGAFRFYRDAGYGEGNGPSFQLGPSGYQDTCWSLADASQGSFPQDRMSSAQLLGDTPAPQPAGIAILYDHGNFGGQYRILTRNVGNFADIGFDNDIESIRIISGTWTFYRDVGYGASQSRPSVTLGAGDYPDVSNVPGYAPGTFPGDLMSSAQVTAGTPPPPQPVQCAPGQLAGATQCHSCTEASDFFPGQHPNSSLPNAAGDGCDCAPGYEWTYFGAVNYDGVLFRRCEPIAVLQPLCPGPYHVLTADGRCVWSCGAGTQPDAASSQCTCQPGLTEIGIDQFGRRQCN